MADQDTYGVSAQILLGADQATLFPQAVKDRTGSLMQINQARLIQSEITGRYIIFGACSRHNSHSRSRNPWVRSNQVQQHRSDSPSNDVLISIMDLMQINETSSMEPGEKSDSLDVDEIVQTCTIITDTDMNQTRRKDDSNQDYADL